MRLFIFKSLFVLTSLLLATVLQVRASGQPLFEENWQSGSIGAQWNVSGHSPPGFFMDVVDIGGGDFALKMGNEALNWTTFIRSVDSYARGDNLRVTMTMWGDPSDGSFVQPFPNAASITGPFHSTNSAGTQIYADVDAGLDLWTNDLRAEQGGNSNGIQNGPGTNNLNAAFQSAVSKDDAVILRVWPGDTGGMAMDYSVDGGTTFIGVVDGSFNPLDTRGQATDSEGLSTGSASPLFLGFSPAQAAVFIDDIKVENDTNNDGNGPPLVIADPPASNDLPFVEDWESGSIDDNKWVTAGHNPPSFHMDVVTTQGQNLLLMGNAALNWTVKIKSKLSFPRGDNLRCTFRVSGEWDPSEIGVGGLDFVQRFPAASGIHGPFHQNGDIGAPIYGTVDEGLDMWWTDLHWEESGAASGIQADNPMIEDAFQDAFAASRGNPMLIRVWAGNTSGGMLEYSTDNGDTFNVPVDFFGNPIDTRDQAFLWSPYDGIETGSTSPLHIGFGPAQGGTYIDDIVVENDSNPYVPAGVTSTSGWVFYP